MNYTAAVSQMYGDWALAKSQSAEWKRMVNITAEQGESYKNPWQNNVSEEYMFLQIIKAPRGDTPVQSRQVLVR